MRLVLMIPEFFFIIVSISYLLHILKYVCDKIRKIENPKMNLCSPFYTFKDLVEGVWNVSGNVALAIYICAFLIGGYTFLQETYIEDHSIGSFWEDNYYEDRYPAKLIKQTEDGDYTEDTIITISRDGYGYSLMSYELSGSSKYYINDYDSTTIDDPKNDVFTWEDVHGDTYEFILKSTEPVTEKSAVSAQTPTKPADSKPASKYVWSTSGGSKYHSNANCSNMKDPQKITLQQALDDGKTKCSRCW